MFPTADQVALAVVTACRLTNEDPFSVYSKDMGVRGRSIAYLALREVFPHLKPEVLTRLSGFKDHLSGRSSARMAQSYAKWWNEIWVDEVVGALVADQYGEQAA